MKAVLPFLLIVIFWGCAGSRLVHIAIRVPELDRQEYYDTAYLEGWEKLKEGRSKVALKRFEQSTLEDEKLFVGFGYAFLIQGKTKLAKQNFEKTLLINPNNSQAELGIASVLEMENDWERAFLQYSRLRSRYPENSWIKGRHEYLQSVLIEAQIKNAEEFKNRSNMPAYIQSLEKAASYSDDQIDIQMQIADFYYSQDDLDRASRYYERILEKIPNPDDILLKLAAGYEKMGKLDTAMVFYKRLLEKKPGDSDLVKRIDEVKSKFYDSNLPPKFKNIFFKYNLNREDMAALIGHYFTRYLKFSAAPIIITDISGSFARDEIIQLCTLGIMDFRPDHRFERFIDVSRSEFAVVLHALVNYLKESGYSLKIDFLDETIEPQDISSLHKYHSIIKFMVNGQFMKLDSENRFKPAEKISPAEAMDAIRKLLNAVSGQ